MRKHNLVGRYYKMPPKERINYLIKNYNCFPALIGDYEQELKEWILAGMSSAWQDEVGDLGVRIQTGFSNSSPTFSETAAELEAQKAIETGALVGLLRCLSDYDEINCGLHEIRLMRREFWRLNHRLELLGPDREIFERFIRKEVKIQQLADEMSVTYDAVKKKLQRAKRKLLRGWVERLGSYDDRSIIYYI